MFGFGVSGSGFRRAPTALIACAPFMVIQQPAGGFRAWVFSSYPGDCKSVCGRCATSTSTLLLRIPADSISFCRNVVRCPFCHFDRMVPAAACSFVIAVFLFVMNNVKLILYFSIRKHIPRYSAQTLLFSVPTLFTLIRSIYFALFMI